MTAYIKQFRLTLRTLAPVHIGSGQKFGSKDYIFEDNAYYFPDMGKLYQHITSKGPDVTKKFEGFLMQSGNNNNRKKPRLIDFLHDARINSRDFGGYKIAASGHEQSDSTKLGDLNDVLQFIRDPYGLPYIPGSSLKGAIRTILMNRALDREYRRGDKENKQAIPWGAKKDRPFDDLFNEIRVADSKPLANEQLTLVQKWDYNPKKSEAKPLPIHRESLKPFTEVVFTVTTTSDRASQLISQLGAYAQQFYDSYKAWYLESAGLPDVYIQDVKQYPIYLGAGSGVWTKTVFKQAEDVIKKKYGKRGKTSMKGKGAFKLTKTAPKQFRIGEKVYSLIKNDDHLYEMGKAMFMIREL